MLQHHRGFCLPCRKKHPTFARETAEGMEGTGSGWASCLQQQSCSGAVLPCLWNLRSKAYLGWRVEGQRLSCTAGDKGARGKWAMDGEADGWRDQFLAPPQPRAGQKVQHRLGSMAAALGWLLFTFSPSPAAGLHQPVTDSLFHLLPAETLMDSTTATAELGWTVHPPSGVSYPVASWGPRAWSGVSCCT